MDDVDALLTDLARWAADARAEDAARSRSRERWLRQQAAEDARFTGVALDLAERGAGVVVRTTTGRTLQGRIAAVARDFCVLVDAGGVTTLVSLPAIVTVRPEVGYRPGDADSERTAPIDTALADVLTGLAGERPRVRIEVEGGGEALAGELRAASGEVATVRLDGEPPATVYLRLESLRELTILG